MKVFFVLVGLLFLLNGCNRLQGYKITGYLPGAKEGTMVRLLSEDTYPPQLIDSAVVLNERFVLEQTVPRIYAEYCRLVVDATPEITDKHLKNLKSYAFFADPGSIRFVCPVDSMPSYYWSPMQPQYQPILTGSLSHDLYCHYQKMVKGLHEKSGELREKYLEIYHRPAFNGIFHTEEGMEIVRARNQINDSLCRLTTEFIRDHRSSVVSLSLAQDMLVRNTTRMTAAEIQEVLSSLDPDLHHAPLMEEVKKVADRALALAKGNKYTDIGLVDTNGRKVKLSAYVKPGIYNILEFWASWCGPCRAEIPHLQRVYEICGKEHCNLVSVSIDEKEADWKKALQEENMAWTQLNDPQGRQGPVREVYRLQGVPFSLILDPEGKIIAGRVRGAEMDVVLQDVLGEKAKGL